MRSFWSDPYLWIHLSGLAAFPLFLEGCLVGFSIGDPIFPVWLELFLVAVVGIAPVLWMQWQRPFYIFSLVAVTVKPERLTDEQRRLLTLFKLPRNRVLAIVASLALVVVLQKVYALAPIAAASLPFLPQVRLVGLLLAAIAFLACNLFVQVPVSVASVMLTSETKVGATAPYPLEQIQRGFTLLGLRLNQILPPVIPPTKSLARTDSVKAPDATTPEAAQSPVEANSLASDLWTDAAAVSAPEPAIVSPTEPLPPEPSRVELSEGEPLPQSETDAINAELKTKVEPENTESESHQTP